ncbi:AzlC family ABC transporter permease [Arhodomonas sp. SL1]|uniref:AzlC family ABC transporter permease n=1 Tax=Arhodomonas sp. SL1 TaxID=3425691 RepID=UPI003F88445F
MSNSPCAGKRHGGAFPAALRTSLPVAFGYVPLGMVFGVLFIRLGHPGWYAVAMSVLVFAGAAQFMAVTLLAAGAGVVEIAATTLVVNARHLFYGLSIGPYLPPRGAGRWYPVFALTDETYSLLTSTRVPPALDPVRFRTTVAALNQAWWVAGTALGVMLGSGLPTDVQGLEFALTALFVVLTVEQARVVRSARPFLIATVAAAAGLAIGGREYMLVAALALVTIMLVIDGHARGELR